ncbi:uncharacterized protein TNCV_1730331 [Trichonephila clavipes]|nr:uncharacterized protein TNCV_1730331 [Trichonephila clavipes]
MSNDGVRHRVRCGLWTCHNDAVLSPCNVPVDAGAGEQTKQLPHVAKVDLVWQLGCNLDQSLSNHGPHVFYRQKIRRASWPVKQFNLVIDEEPLDNACHVWSRIILLKYGCG